MGKSSTNPSPTQIDEAPGQPIVLHLGWQNGELVPWAYLNTPEDGIMDFDFIADAPTGYILPVISHINTAPFMAETPTWLKGVRIHASTNVITTLIDETEHLKEKVQFFSNDFRVDSDPPLPRDFEPKWPSKPMPWPLPIPKLPLPDMFKPDLLKMPINSIKGRPIRVYTEGDVITKDFVANRINFVLDKTSNLVSQIWVG